MKLLSTISGLFKDKFDRWVVVMQRPQNAMDMFDFMDARGMAPLSEHMARSFMTEVMEGLIQMASRHMGYMDLKLENLIVDPLSMKIWLIDLAFCVDFDEVDPKRSRIKGMMGTKEYATPEHLLGRGYTWEGNTVWTLGCLLFDMLHGCDAFNKEEDIVNLSSRVKLRSGLSQEVRDLLLSCLEKNERKRISLDGVCDHPWFKGLLNAKD